MSGLRRQAFVTLGSGLLVSLAGDIVRLLTMMILARLLLPEDYGTFAMATAVSGWLVGVGFLNFAPHILREQPSPHDISTLLLFGLSLHGALTLCGLMIAALLATVAHRPVEAVLVALAVLALPIYVPADIELQLLQREFRWRPVRLWQVGTMLLASAVSILLASQGHGPFALVAGVLIEPLPFALLLFITRSWRPLCLDRDLLGRLQRFGWPMVAGSLSWKTRELISAWAVGLALGATELGLLGRATGLAGLVLGRFSAQVGYMLLPVLARAQEDPDRRRRAGSLLLRLVAWSTVPAAVLLALLADLLVVVLYGERWLEVAPLLPLAAAAALVHVHLQACMPLLLASGRTRQRLICDLLFFAGTLALLPAVAFGLAAYLCAMTAATLLPAVYVLRAAFNDGWFDRQAVRDAFLPPLVAAAVGGLTAAALRSDLAGLAADLLAAATFVLVFAGLLRLLFARPLSDLVEVLPGRAWLMRLALLPAVRSL